MTYEQLEDGLHKGEPTVVENVGQPVYGMPAPGYQQGYPVQQQPMAGWPAYGAPPGVYGTGVPPPYPGQPYPYLPPPPVGGGSEDEKYQISDVGVATVVPGLTVPKYQRIALLFGATTLLVGAATLLGLAGWMVTIAAGVSSILWVCGFFELALAVFMIHMFRKGGPTCQPSITPESIEQYMDRVTKIGATLPQINIVRSMLEHANPNTPHEFSVWKTSITVHNGSLRTHVVSSYFGCQNLSRGQTPQKHLFALVA